MQQATPPARQARQARPTGRLGADGRLAQQGRDPPAVPACRHATITVFPFGGWRMQAVMLV